MRKVLYPRPLQKSKLLSTSIVTQRGQQLHQQPYSGRPLPHHMSFLVNWVSLQLCLCQNITQSQLRSMTICQTAHLRIFHNLQCQQSWLPPIVQMLDLQCTPPISVKEMPPLTMSSLSSLANVHARNVAIKIVLAVLDGHTADMPARIVGKQNVVGATASTLPNPVLLLGTFITRSSSDVVSFPHVQSGSKSLVTL